MTSNVKYISAVPAIKTIPGLDEFDYAVKMDASVELGDLIRVPFRKKLIPALIVGIKSSSRFADKAILIESPEYIFRLGKDASILLTACASQSFTSKPTVFSSWLRTVPKKLKVKAKSQPNSQMSIGSRETRFLVDRLHDQNGLIQTARQIKGKTLILCPWQKRAANIANLLSCPILHGEVTPTNSWQILDDFINGSQDKIVTTRIGAWLATQADNCLVDEPENDDYKSDEQTPRLDARWIIEVSAKLKLNLNLIYFSTTPKLSIDQVNWNAVKSIEAEVTFEHWQKRGFDFNSVLSNKAKSLIQENIEDHKKIIILHPIKGEVSRIACRDCGWSAKCPWCGFTVSMANNLSICRRCGKKSELILECPSCGGTDLSKGRTGVDKLKKITADLPAELFKIIDISEFNETGVDKDSLVIVSDISLLGGYHEDVRRRERLIIAWRRLAAEIKINSSRLYVQGPENVVELCRDWLTQEGLKNTWNKELKDRNDFKYPPNYRLIKLIVSGNENNAKQKFNNLISFLPKTIEVAGPYPVQFRNINREPRFTIHLIAPIDVKTSDIIKMLDMFKKEAIIDLDPIAFFS